MIVIQRSSILVSSGLVLATIIRGCRGGGKGPAIEIGHYSAQTPPDWAGKVGLDRLLLQSLISSYFRAS